MDFDSRPILVFWETTRACSLACLHCRASAIPEPLPGELTEAEGERLLEQIAGFGRPAPVIVATGGDVLMRRGIERLVGRARLLSIPVALAPSVTPLLTDKRVVAFRNLGVKVASVSLDGATAATHDGIRGVDGHFERTLEAIGLLRRHRIKVQVNTLVSRRTVDELPRIARLARDRGASIWELFFLVRVGRGVDVEALTAEENEHVAHFLVDASRYAIIVRTVEGPFFRRVVAARAAGEPAPTDGLYPELLACLRGELGSPVSPPRAQTKGTRDGCGIIFVGHDGTITPSGFLPLALGNVRTDDIVQIYREHPMLRSIRAADFHGRCGICPYRDLCGGSRARAYTASGDALGDDPGCALEPLSL